MFFNKKQKHNDVVLKDIYLQSNNLQDLIDNQESLVTISPSYLAGLQLLVNELARFKLVIDSKKVKNFLENAKVIGQVLNGSYEVLRYIYTKLLDSGSVALVIYNDVLILGGESFKAVYNKNGDFAGLEVNGIRVGKDKVILINLNDTQAGGFRDWLKDVIQLEKNLVSYLNVYTKSFGLFGAYKLNVDAVDERSINLLQSMLADARRKMQKGAIPVLPNSVDTINKEMGWQAIELIQNYIIKTICRVMGIPLLALQARDQGSYALAKEERAMWYETSLRGYVELVRCAIEKWLKENVDAAAVVSIDTSDIDYLNQAKEWSASEINILLMSNVISVDEARAMLNIQGEEGNQKQAVGLQKKKDGLHGNQKKKEEEIVEDLDVKVHDLHEKTIQVLEKKAEDVLIKRINKVINTFTKENFKKIEISDGITKDGLDNDFINGIIVAVNQVVRKWLDDFYKKAVEKSIFFLKELNTDVFINYEDLLEGLNQMAEKSSKWIGEINAEAIKQTITSLLQSGKQYTWEEVAETLQNNLIPRKRAITISRTEINRACAFTHAKNAEVMKSIAEKKGVKVVKRWSTSLDEKVRKSHVQAGMQGWIDYDKKFVNGLMHPYDVNASAKETVNCRCVLLTKIIDEGGR